MEPTKIYSKKIGPTLTSGPHRWTHTVKRRPGAVPTFSTRQQSVTSAFIYVARIVLFRVSGPIILILYTLTNLQIIMCGSTLVNHLIY